MVILESIKHFLSQDFSIHLLRIAVLIVVGWPLVGYFVRFVLELMSRYRYENKHVKLLIRRVIIYTGHTLIAISILHELGFNVSTLVGAAGICGVAVAVASQACVSHVISGFFLITETPFKVGDTIEFQGISGTVESINLLSVSVCTLDKRIVRLPNESLIKYPVINASSLYERRFDFTIEISYSQPARPVIKLIEETIKKNSFASHRIKPLVYVSEFKESTVTLFAGAHAIDNEYLSLKNSLLLEIQEAFAQEKIEIPYQHITVTMNKDV